MTQNGSGYWRVRSALMIGAASFMGSSIARWTIDWYFSTKDRDQVPKIFNDRLTER
jgi:hypothetical protein